MSEFRIDPLFGTACLVARERAARPHRMRTRDEVAQTGPCPLCPGNETLCPPEIASYPGRGARWLSRVFPNRYPAVSLEAEFEEGRWDALEEVPCAGNRKADSWPGFGAHEIVVDSPNHQSPFWTLDPAQGVETLRLMQSRIRDLYKDRRIHYVQAFKNHRAGSGATLDHPHFQLVALPFVPAPVARVFGADDAKPTEDSAGNRCRVCKLLRMECESSPGTAASESDDRVPPPRLLSETSRFVAVADQAPNYAYQFSIYPRKHMAGFELCDAADLEDLAQICSLVLGRFERLLGEVPLNMTLFNQPNPAGFGRDENDTPAAPATQHWFIRVSPRLARHAGFELSTGIAIVHVAPEDAARSFREKGI